MQLDVVMGPRSQEACEGHRGLSHRGDLQGACSGSGGLGVAGGERLGAPHFQWVHDILTKLFVRALNLILGNILDVTKSLFIPTSSHKKSFLTRLLNYVQ